MMMPGRKYDAGSGYRYGFNGKELDRETSSTTSYDYGFRIYNPTLGKFLSVDPLTNGYPMLTPYQFASNTPIQALDVDGLEAYHYLRFKDENGKTVLAFLEEKDIIERVLVSTEKQWVDNGMGGASLETIDKFEEVKNPRKDYIVWSLDITRNGLRTYDEDRTFNTYEAALNSTDKDFEGTDDDYVNEALGGIGEFLSGFQDQSIEQFRRRGTKPRSASKLQMNDHHLVPKGLKNANEFVKKAVRGGFKMDGVKNLLPVTRYLKRYNKGQHAKHPKYTKQIDDHLNSVDITKMKDVDANNYLQKLNRHLIKKIKSNPKVKINDIDLDLKNFNPNKAE